QLLLRSPQRLGARVPGPIPPAAAQEGGHRPPVAQAGLLGPRPRRIRDSMARGPEILRPDPVRRRPPFLTPA
ncbi:hypothetical protein J0J29_23500, partial [Vibrio vulnificus]|uniref:hypothetical protein n=1 Tax=Vibrio vulnificus TaxID=672 RepID=UPI0019D46348